MENKEQLGTFSYSYSAAEQEEIKRIRDKYLPPEADKMEQVRRLDSSASSKAMAVSIAAGVIGTLILGVGMCCCLVWAERFFILGVIVGLLGGVVLAAAYPLYQRVLKKERKRLAPEILRLTDELMK